MSEASRPARTTSVIPYHGGCSTASVVIWRELVATGAQVEVVMAFGGDDGFDKPCFGGDFRAWEEYVAAVSGRTPS